MLNLQWAWELFTRHWKLDKDRLWVTIYKDDDESYDIWNKVKGLNSDRILRFGNILLTVFLVFFVKKMCQRKMTFY